MLHYKMCITLFTCKLHLQETLPKGGWLLVLVTQGWLAARVSYASGWLLVLVTQGWLVASVGYPELSGC